MSQDLAAVIPSAKDRCAFVASTHVLNRLQQPLRLRADVVVHSATKFIGGHADLLAGVAITNDATVQARLRQHRKLHGATPGALEMFLALRGLRTLPLRFERAQDNARRLVEFLRAHPRVHSVRYPTMTDPGTGESNGFGAVISFEIDGSADDADSICGAVRVIRPATSLGGVESTMERRAKLAGQAHLPPTLLRLAVGIEDVDDLRRLETRSHHDPADRMASSSSPDPRAASQLATFHELARESVLRPPPPRPPR